MKFTINHIEELKPLAEKILSRAENRKVFIFKGDLGAGKTTFIKELCALLNISEETSSPTYSIVNEYLAATGKVYHIDLYRLKSIDEAYEVGLEDYLYSDNYCFIEWPQIAEDLLPESYVSIQIEKDENNTRIFQLELF